MENGRYVSSSRGVVSSPGQIEQAGLDAAGDQDAARLALLAAHDAAGKAVENLRRVRLRIRHNELRRLLLAQPLLGQQL